MTIALLSESDIIQACDTLGDWHWKREVPCLFIRISCEDYAKAFGIVAMVSLLAERQNHHPSISFGWGYVTLRISTHDVGGITKRDINFASAVNELLL